MVKKQAQNSGDSSEIIELQPTGKAPIRFIGRLLASDSTEGTRSNRVRIFSLVADTGNGYIVEIEWVTEWRKEPSWTNVLRCETLADVKDLLGRWDPTHHLRGYPEGENYRAKQERLIRDITDAWEIMASGLMKRLGVEGSIDDLAIHVAKPTVLPD